MLDAEENEGSKERVSDILKNKNQLCLPEACFLLLILDILEHCLREILTYLDSVLEEVLSFSFGQ